MKRLFLALRAFLQVVRLPKAVEWNEMDAQSFRAFLNTPTGAKLNHILTTRIVQFNDWAAEKADLKSCGQATGFKMAAAYTFSLAAAHSGKSEPPADNNGAAGTLDHLRP